MSVKTDPSRLLPGPEQADRTQSRRDGRPLRDGDLRAKLQQLGLRQQRFEKQLARALEVDAAGLEAMDHLVSSGPQTPTELARQLSVSTAAMTLVLNRLEAAGHVRRERHPSDGRKLVVTASEASVAQLYRQVLPTIARTETLIASLGDAERAAVDAFLGRLLAIYDEGATEGAGPR